MANLSKTRTLFAFTSPRTIEKIIPEIELLVNSYAGQQWSGNSELQADFYDALVNSDFFEEQRQNNNPDFAARDRITRAPKALGFVDLKPRIALTEVGARLLSGTRTHEVIAKQLFKFQLPSPFHKTREERNFNVRPYLELLRLVKELDNLSKTEIAIFFLQLTNHELFEDIVSKIRTFRRVIAGHRGNRKEFIDRVFTAELETIYAEEIRTNDLRTRESDDSSLTKFLRTKKSNHLDYADAFIRYLRATQLISLDKKTFRVIIAPARVDEVEYVLTMIPREAIAFATERAYKDYLFSPATLLLLTDIREYVEGRLRRISIQFDAGIDIETLKDLLETSEEQRIVAVTEETAIALKDYNEFDDVIDVFDKILGKDIPDPSLYLEWNIWRAMVMVNYAKEIIGNFRLDLDGMPLNTALGNLPDIQADYDRFKLIVEVTMSRGNKQYEMEGEPVARHFGNVQRQSDVPVYCLFIAPKISEGALAHFFNLNKNYTKRYGGKTRIVPLDLIQFIAFITKAKDKNFNNSNNLKAFLDTIIEDNSSADDEEIWYQNIDTSVAVWLN